MKKNTKIRMIAILCLGLALIFTGIKAGEEFEHIREQQAHTESPDAAPALSADEEFSSYLDDLFRQEVTASTIDLHYTLKNPENYGITEYPISFGAIGEEEDLQDVALLENVNAILKKTDKSALSDKLKLTYDILQDHVNVVLSGQELSLYEEPLRPTTGLQAELPVILAEYSFYREQDIKDYLALLNELPNFFNQILDFEQKKSEAGLFMPSFGAEDIISQCGNFIANKEDNYLLDTFRDKLSLLPELSEEQRNAYIEQNHAAVLEKVIPTYENLMQGISALKDNGKNDRGLSAFDKGKDFYALLVRLYTGSDWSIDEMKQRTEQQRAQDMADAAKLLLKNPTLMEQASTYAFSQTEPTVILEDLQEKTKADFPAPPDTAFTIKYVHPSLEEFMAPAFYLAVPLDDISQNSIYINDSSHYTKMKLYTTLAHEGYPGHLYQNIMERSADLPLIRSLLGTQGYSEGWATYVEMLSYSYANIDKDLAQILELDQSALLSLYATADMGIHWDGWDLAKTKEFFKKYQITDSTTVTSIYHTLVEEPGHYLKYYIGYLGFLDLKVYAKEKFGADYSDYKFHKALMDMGPAQFSILREYLPSYWPKAD
ncbi:Tat pathway signal protein [Clostridia bacterium]|nr:Tat pathway signal protein [Clostridia bacterium]